MPLFQKKKRTNYSVENVCLFHHSAPQNGIIPFLQQKKPLLLLYYSSAPPKVEPAMLSLSESESTVIVSYSATGW